jgi:hypothetical protein
MLDSIYENNNYYVVMGESQILQDAEVYLVRNKRTGVIEAEEQMLPKIIDYADQLDTALQELSEAGKFSSEILHS